MLKTLQQQTAARQQCDARTSAWTGAGGLTFSKMNPLPTFAPDGSFGIIAEILGRPLDDLLAEVLGEALSRLGLAPPA